MTLKPLTTPNSVTIVTPAGAIVFDPDTGKGYFWPEKGDGPIPIKGIEKYAEVVATASSVLAATEGINEFDAVRKDTMKSLLLSARRIESAAKSLNK